MENLNNSQVNQSQPRSGPVPEEEARWSFRAVLSQGNGASILYPTLTIPGHGCPQEGA